MSTKPQPYDEQLRISVSHLERREGMNPSIKTYKQICKILGVKPANITEGFQAVPGASLVIVPDEVFTVDKLEKLAVAFGKYQLISTYFDKDFISKYQATELCGVPTGKAYRSIYIPHEANIPTMTYAQYHKQKFDTKIPTLLESIVYWFVLRESGETLNWNSTYTRFYDLEPSDGCFPGAVVGDDGEAVVGLSFVRTDAVSRRAVGPQSLSSPDFLSSATDLQENTKALNRNSDLLEKIFKVEAELKGNK